MVTTSHSEGRSVPPVPEIAREDAVSAAERLLEAIHVARGVFESQELAVGRLVTALRSDLPLRDILANADFRAERDSLSAAIDGFETARREARIEAWRQLLEEGCSIGEIARIFALSRQLVSRQLRDAGVTLPDP
jgi:hypothetical protein